MPCSFILCLLDIRRPPPHAACRDNSVCQFEYNPVQRFFLKMYYAVCFFAFEQKEKVYNLNQIIVVMFACVNPQKH